MVQNTKASVRTYGLRMMADFRCRVVEMLLDGMQLDLDGREVWVKFLGRFNAYNLTAVYATALLLGADRDEVLRTLSGLGPVDGRFESIRSHDGVTAIVDYAAYARRVAERHRYDRRNQGQGPEAVCGSRLRRPTATGRSVPKWLASRPTGPIWPCSPRTIPGRRIPRRFLRK